MSTIHDLFDEYAESHQHPVNKLIHWFCVPLIFFSIVCILSEVPLGPFSAATVLLMFSIVFYFRLSPPIATGVVVFYIACLWGAAAMRLLPFQVWQSALGIFVVAWIGQFIGHHIEGKNLLS
jgi:uncharacterized membrane protein YGL010W